MKNLVNKILNAIGVIFIILGIIAFYRGFVFSGAAGMLWFSYMALFLIGIGILTKKPYLIGSQVNIILIPYIIWNIDFFYTIITGSSLFGIADYFFTSRPILSQIITIQHIFLIPVSLAALYMTKIKRTDFWKISLIEITGFFFLIKIINPSENINCIFENCLPFTLSIIPYSLIWFIVYIIMIFATNLLIVKIFKSKS